MIIPVKCFTCGKVLADKYRYYQREVRKRKQKDKQDEIIYMTLDNIKKTHDANVMDELGIKKICCRKHMLTHVDII